MKKLLQISSVMVVLAMLAAPGGCDDIITLRDRGGEDLLREGIAAHFEELAGDSIAVRVKFPALSALFEETVLPLQVSIAPVKRLLPGTQVVALECRGSGEKVSRHYLNVEVKLSGQLAYPLRLIGREKVICEEDIEIRSVDLESTGLSGLVLHPELLTGMEATRHLAPGSPIRWDQVQQPSLVHMGEKVEVVLQSDTYAIKTSAVALQTGALGEEIWVRLENNGKRKRAVVVDADRVSLE